MIIANTDPTALGGTPLVTPEGIVLGGNSRTMVLQRVYHANGPAAAAYRKHLADHLHEFGLPREALAGLRAPVIVRVVEVPAHDQARLRDLVRRYNEGLTQELERTAEQVAVSARLNDAILAELQRVEDDTLAAFLASPASKGLVRLLLQAELIPKTRQGRLINKDGLLSDEGRAFLQRALLGRILPHPDLLDLLSDSIKDSLARATPYVLNAASVHNDPPTRALWDVAHRLPDAVRLWSRARAASLKDATELASQRELTTDGLDPLDTANVLLANILLLRAGPRQLPDGFRAFADASAFTTTPTLFGEHPAPVEALAKAAKLPLPNAAGIRAVPDFSPVPDAPPVPKTMPKPVNSPPMPAPKSTPEPKPPAPKPVPSKLPTLAEVLHALEGPAGAWYPVGGLRVRRDVPVIAPWVEVVHVEDHGGKVALWSFRGGNTYLLLPEHDHARMSRGAAVLLAMQQAELGVSSPKAPRILGGAPHERGERITRNERVLYLERTAQADGQVYVPAGGTPIDPPNDGHAQVVWVIPRKYWQESFGVMIELRDLKRVRPVGIWTPVGWTWGPYDRWLGHATPDQNTGGWWALSATGFTSDAVRVKPEAAAAALKSPEHYPTKSVWWVPSSIYRTIAALRKDRARHLVPMMEAGDDVRSGAALQAKGEVP